MSNQLLSYICLIKILIKDAQFLIYISLCMKIAKSIYPINLRKDLT